MKNDALTMTLLFDTYGELLTEKQQTCLDLYYNQDFSLAEIAEHEGISRQGVHDCLVRSEATLQLLEEKTGCLRRAAQTEKVLMAVEPCLTALMQSSEEDTRRYAAQIAAAVRTLKEEAASSP